MFADNARGNDKKDFLCEIEMMKKVCTSTCPNIVAMLGCVTTKEPLCLVTEYVSHGDLLTYLRTMRKMVRRATQHMIPQHSYTYIIQ